MVGKPNGLVSIDFDLVWFNSIYLNGKEWNDLQEKALGSTVP